MEQSIHVPVMPKEILSYLKAEKAGTYLDCTLGGAGHSRAILDANPQNQLKAIDRDLNATSRAEQWIPDYSSRCTVQHASFSEIAVLFEGHKFNGVLADLGISSDQLSENRGFSFKDADNLDMRMDTSKGQTAQEVINNLRLEELKALLQIGGVQKQAYQIAEAIVNNRPYTNAKQLADTINKVVKVNPNKKINPATIAFQAIRIHVNDEFNEIKTLLDVVPKIVAEGARLVIISFHSLEDKLVTSCMRSWANTDSTPALWQGQKQPEEPLGKLLTKKAIVASDEEQQNNPRSRSAMLRCFEFKA